MGHLASGAGSRAAAGRRERTLDAAPVEGTANTMRWAPAVAGGLVAPRLAQDLIEGVHARPHSSLRWDGWRWLNPFQWHALWPVSKRAEGCRE